MATVTGQTITQLTLSVNEKDVENSYRQYFTRKFSDMIFTSPFSCDGLGESKSQKIRVLTEFKDELNLLSKSDQIKVLAQTVYYIKKFELAGIMLPTTVFVGDRNECFVIHSNDLFKYLSMDLDWSIAPSNAHKNLVLVNEMMLDENINPHIFSIHNIDECIVKLKDLTGGVTRLIPITPINITEVFSYFEKNVLGKHNLNTNQLANLFVQILINPDDNYLHPVKKRKTIVTKSFNEVPVKTKESFSSFFSHFSNEYSPTQKEDLTAVVDRLIEDITRRKQGEFFTPALWANKAHEYIASVYGEDWKEKYVVWDPAWGTGNLTRGYKFKELYVSTLNYSDIQTANQMGYNPEAVKFQFDFLNDDYDFLPKGLREAIEGGKEIIVLMNPPYATSGEFSTEKGKNKNKTSKTKINQDMVNLKLDKSSMNLYSQFIFRLFKMNESLNSSINLCFFSPSLYLTGSSFSKFRNLIFSKFSFDKGFLFDASNFADVSGKWSILFSILSVDKTSKNLNVDLLELSEYSIKTNGTKLLYNTDNEIAANKWVKSQIKSIKIDAPMLTSPLNVTENVVNPVNLQEGFLGYMDNKSNNVYYNNSRVALYSSSFSDTCGSIIMKDNFNRVCELFLSRKIINVGWENCKDEYMCPNETDENYLKFSNDSIIYSLFNNSSNQSSLRQITYKDQLWDIKNEFFWMSKEEMTELANNNNYNELYGDARTDKNRYVHTLLFGEENIYEQLSPDAKLVLDKATEMVRMSMTMRSQFADEYNHLNSWDAGYAQLKLVWKTYFPEEFKEFRQLYKDLETRMRPLVYELGFLLK
jgi:hypothetical protein